MTTLTGTALLTGFGRFIADLFESTTTGAGTTTTLVDTKLTEFGDRRLEGWYIRITLAGTNQWVVRRINNFAAATGTATVTPAFPATTGNATTYELHRYDPTEKFRALDDARAGVFTDVFTVLRDESITGDGISTEYAIPSGISGSPVAVFLETPLSPGMQWNTLTNPYMDSLTGWAASGGTATIVNQSQADPGVPKYDSAATKWTIPLNTAVTYQQLAAQLSITPAQVAGRSMVAAMWVYSRVAGRVTLSVSDDSGTLTNLVTTGTHTGRGWQMLAVTVAISASASTTLTVSLNVTTGAAMVVFMNRAFFFLGDQFPIRFDSEPFSNVEFDSNYQRFKLPYGVRRGWQLRVVGKAILSPLGNTAATQVTNTMEVTEQTAMLLYAEAAGVLFRRLGLKVNDVANLQKNMAIVDEQRQRLRMEWQLPSPARRIESPFR